MAPKKSLSSAGHKLGQMVGDWYEEFFALPLLEDVASELGLYLDTRFKNRPGIRQGKILWDDRDGNTVDYDFVLELPPKGKNPLQTKGEPIGFFETFWRRGARHSKDKSRDDSGKLTPMKSAYPTARVLGIVAAGDFTAPARDFVKSRSIELFYVPKDKILAAWRKHQVEIDYPDKLAEGKKLEIVTKAEQAISKAPGLKALIANTLREMVGPAQLLSYKNTLKARLGASPQEYRIIVRGSSAAFVHYSHSEAQAFLSGKAPDLKFESISYVLEVVFGDGDSYYADELTWKEVGENFERLSVLINHMEKIALKSQK